MKNKNLKLSLAAIMAAMALTVTGCGGDAEPETEAATKAETQAPTEAAKAETQAAPSQAAAKPAGPQGGQTPGGPAPGGQTPGGQKPGGQTPGGQKPGGQPAQPGPAPQGPADSEEGYYDGYDMPYNTLTISDAYGISVDSETVDYYFDDQLGTYFNRYMAGGGETEVVNECSLNDMIDMEGPEDYITRKIATIDDSAHDIKIFEDDRFHDGYGYPSYTVSFQSGYNEDTWEYTGFVILTDNFTYVYYMGCWIDNFYGMSDFYLDMLNEATLVDSAEY